MRNGYVGVAVGASLATVAVIGALWWLGVLAFLTGGDDDRPPVVVSSGSVEFHSEVHPKNGKPGKFEDVGSGKKWLVSHAHRPPKAFAVNIERSTSNTPACKVDNLFTKVSQITFTYVTGGGETKDFFVSVQSTQGKRALHADFGEAATQPPNEDYRISLPGTLQKVTIGNSACNLNSQSRVNIYQTQ